MGKQYFSFRHGMSYAAYQQMIDDVMEVVEPKFWMGAAAANWIHTVIVPNGTASLSSGEAQVIRVGRKVTVNGYMTLDFSQTVDYPTDAETALYVDLGVIGASSGLFTSVNSLARYVPSTVQPKMSSGDWPTYDVTVSYASNNTNTITMRCNDLSNVTTVAASGVTFSFESTFWANL